MQPAPPRAADLLDPRWRPLADVERGYARLDDAARARVTARVRALGRPEHLSARVRSAPDPTPFRALFSFLAHVEVVAIEVPLRFLDTAPESARADLARQLEDEVVHSVVFARLADHLGGVEPPLPAMEQLLDVIRAPQDLALGTTLLNLLAEGWIEALLDHATGWDVAPNVLAAIKADETRHVHQAVRLSADVDPAKLRAEVERLEAALVRVMSEPRLALVLMSVAGADKFAAFTTEMLAAHKAHLAEIDLEPVLLRAPDPEQYPSFASSRDRRAPDRVDAGLWRAASQTLWDDPASPVMVGYLDVPVGHVKRGLTTAALVAAIGQAWAEEPRYNRVLSQGRVWQLPHADVGVRVALDAVGEAVGTVVVPDADKLSLNDIRLVLRAGTMALREGYARAGGAPGVWDGASRWRAARDLAPHLPPETPRFSVAISNVGKFGLQMGTGAMQSTLAPSTELFVGERRKLPVWRGVMYVPSTHVTIGCMQDHRVHDGAAAGGAMRALKARLTRAAWRAIRARPDTLRDEAAVREALARASPATALPPELAALAAAGVVKISEADAIAIGTLMLGGGAAAGAGVTYAVMKARDKKAAPPAEAPVQYPPKPPEE